MFVPPNALELLNVILKKTDAALKAIPRCQVIGYTEIDKRRDIFLANVGFIKNFHEFLSAWFDIEPDNFFYRFEIEQPLPRIIHDGKPGVPYRIFLRFWDESKSYSGGISIMLPHDLWEVAQCIDLMYQDLESKAEFVAPLQISYFGLSRFKRYCETFLGSKKLLFEKSKSGEAPQHVFFISDKYSLVYIDEQSYSFPDRIRKALAFIIRIHLNGKKYFDRKELLRDIGEDNFKMPLRDLFRYHTPIWDFIKRAQDSSGKYIQNKYYLLIDINNSRIE